MPQENKSVTKSFLPGRKGRIHKNFIVTQANDLIGATIHLSLNAKKFLSCLISKIKPDDEEFCTYWVSVDDFLELAGIRTHNDYFKILVEVSAELRSVSIVSKNANLRKISGLIRDTYDDESAKIVGAELNADLKPFLLQLRDNFTSYQLQYVMRLKSTYAIKLYELLRQSLKGKRSVVIRYDIEELKGKLLPDDSKHQLFNNFKRRVLEIAEREINQKTDLRFHFTPVRVGRAFKYIEFAINLHERIVITEKSGEEVLVVNEAELPAKIIEYLPESERKNQEIYRLIAIYLDSHGPKYVEKQVAYTSDKNPKNYVGYLKKALESDYGKNFNPNQLGLFKAPSKTESRTEEKILADKYEKYRDGQIERYRKTLPKTEIAALTAEAEKSVSGKKIKIGIKTAIMLNLKEILAKHAEIQSYEEWLKTIKTKK